MAKICALKINKVRRLISDMLATLWHAEKLDVFLIAASHLWPVKISVLSPIVSLVVVNVIPRDGPGSSGLANVDS